ncbi:MAG: hypothetical protein VX278_04705, partial [Myxococcota bacterium]|nr:hypothetical protein [Myxococcota bacterium]
PHQPIAEAIEFQQELRKEEYPFAGYIINRAPPSLSITPEDFNQMNAEQQAWIRWTQHYLNPLQEHFEKGKREMERHASCWFVEERSGPIHNLEHLQTLGESLPT